jgi:hypothetical protein
MALPLILPLAAKLNVPTPLKPLPLLVTLPLMLAVVPLPMVRATLLLIVRALQVKVPGVVLLAITASTVDDGLPLLHVLPFHVVEVAAK